MSDNLYILYLKHISEGDVAAGQEGAISPQLKNIINNASNGENGANKCMSFLNKKFGIKDVSSFCNCIKKLFTSATGAAGKFLAKIWSGVQAAMRWALKLIKRLTSINTREESADKFSGFGNTRSLRDRNIDYGARDYYNLTDTTIRNAYLGISFMACAVITVFSKTITKLKNVSVNSINKANYRGHSLFVRNGYWNDIGERANECKAMFSDLDQLIESSQLSEGPEIRKFIDSYIQKIQPKVMELWGKIDTIARSNKVLAIVIAVCTACIFSYMGLKKALGNRKQKEVALA